ncbi:MAG: hypothetical protein U9N09_10440 [Euryarchaeota archaeon]|nr:hypothetical protein [Euryarchaeota archaeon]
MKTLAAIPRRRSRLVMSNMLQITDHTLLPEGRETFGIDAAEDIKGMDADCVVMAVSHDAFRDISLSVLKGVMNSDPVLVDIRGMFGREDAERMGFCYREL